MNNLKLFLFFAFLYLQAYLTPAYSQTCPTIEAIMVNGCAAFEPDGEFMIINSQETGISVDDFTINFYSNTTGVNADIGPGEDCSFMTPPLSATLTGCSNVIEVGPGDFIPPNSLVVVITSAGGDGGPYDWSPLCGGGETVYLLQNDCDRTAGAFKDDNAPGEDRTTEILLPGCTDALTYEPDLNSGTDGDYVLPCVPSPTCPDGVTYHNDGCVAPDIDIPCTPNDFNPITNVTQCDSYVLPVISGANLTGNEAYYTMSGGGGTQYAPGTSITSSTILFVYDATLPCTDEESFNITINTTPTANTPSSSLDICYTLVPPALLSENLSVVENEITGGNGSLTVNWYFDPAATMPIDFANAAQVISLLPTPSTIYATVDDGSCESSTVEVTVNLVTPPNATSVTTTECDEGGGFATFDLTSLENNIDGDGNTVTFYMDMAATPGSEIMNPTNYTTMATTVYAVVSSGNGCDSEPVAVNLNVSPPLTADISVSPASGCGTVDVTVTFVISGPDTYDITLQIGNPTSGYTTVSNNVGNGDTYTTTITETTEFVIVAAAFPAGGCPFTFPTSPEEVTVDPGPEIDNISDVNSCGSYTLPAIPYISGDTGNGAYYTGPNASGTQYLPGAVINTTTQLYAFDGMLPDCFDEEPFLVTITQAPDLQLSGTAEVCDGESFDLSTIVFDAQGTGISITYHDNTPPDAGNELPSSLVNPSSNTTYYAYADGGPGCQSEVAIPVNVLPLPTANTAALSACDEGGNTATFDVTTVNNTVNGGTGFTVNWFQDMALNVPVGNPLAYMSGTSIVYAVVDNGTCESAPAVVNLTVLPAPLTNPAGPLETCDSGSGQGTFDLTTLDNTINGGSGMTVSWFTDAAGTNPIATPGSFLSGAGTVYATVFDGTCTSPTEPVILNLIPGPSAFDYSTEACGTPSAVFDLTSAEFTNAVTGGNGATVSWYIDPAGNTPLFNPSNYVSTITTIVYAIAELNGCTSQSAQVTLNVTQAPSASTANLVDCDDGSGQATFNLSTLNNTVNNGSGLIVNYFTDAAASNQIFNTNSYVSGNATIYAQVQDSNCPSEIVPITLTIQPGPTAIDQTLGSCDTGNGQAIFDLTTINFAVSQGSGNVNWYISTNPDVPVPDDQAYLSGDGQVIAIVDNGTCFSEATVTLEVTPGLDISITESMAVSCFGGSDASIEVTVNNGSPAFSFDWNVDVLDGTEDPISVGAGNYEVTVTDADNCAGTAAITILEPTELTLICAENTPVSIVNGSDGIGSVSISGGTAPYSIDYSGPVSGNQIANAEGESLINNLEAGMYDVTITDDNNCTTTCSFTINDPGCALSLETMVTDPLCSGDTTGIVDLTIIGGESPYTIDWNVDSLDGLEDLTDLLAGNYSVTVTDNNGCTANTTATITDPQALTISCNQNAPVTVQGGSDGIATIDLSGGTAPFLVEWNGPVSGNQNESMAGLIDITGLEAGDYNITVTDDNGCAIECSFSISEPGCDLSLETSAIDPLCSGDTTGIIDLTINGGVSPFTIDWNIDSLDGLEDLVNLLAGNYSVTVTDINGCTASTTATITAPEPLILMCSQSSPVSVMGGNDGVAAIDFSGGTAPYFIEWSGPVSGNQNEATAGMVDITGLEAGDYTVTITDDNGCVTDCIFTINDAGCMMTLSIMGFDENCQGASDGRIELIVFNGTNPLTIDWDDDSLDGLLEPMDIGPGDYQVTVTDGSGCTATTSVTIGTTFSAPTVSLSEGGSICEEACFDFDFSMTGTAPFTVNYTLTDDVGTTPFSFTSQATDTTIQICPVDLSLTGNNITIDVIDISDLNCNSLINQQDSILINNSTVNTIDDILCPGESVTVNGEVYDIDNPTGMETLVGANANGCDSIININLTFLDNPVFDFNPTICEGESIIVNGTTYDENMTTGTEILENAAANGCDSIINVNLSFLDTPEFDFNPEICPGESIIVNGTTYDENMTAGTEILENAAANGCDSIINVNLSFLDAPELDFNPEICPGESIIVNGTTYDENMTTGTEILENAAANGCDSIINVNLSFLDTPEFDFNPEICPGESIIVNGTTYDENMTTGTEILENAAANGCDSIINVNLSFLDTPEFDFNPEICPGESIIVNGTTYDENMTSGTEILENAAANGCDSIINVNLSFLDTPELDFNPEICPGESIIVNGTTYDENMTTGTEILENAAANGCDSIINVNLSFLDTPVFDFNPEICPGESIIVNGTTYDENMTTGTEVLENAAANGCDSIINVNLSFLDTPVFDLNQALCSGESIIVNGTTYDENMTNGTEVLENAAANGCDSIINVNLSFLVTPEFDLEQTLCAGESIVVNGTTYNAGNPEGTEILESGAANGCDSIVNVSLSFYSNLEASISGDTNICSGESTELVFNFNGVETFTVQYSGENGEVSLLNDISDGYIIEVSPTSSTNYNIDFIIVSGTNCPVNIDDGALVNVSELTTTLTIDQPILCGNSADGVISANASAGIPPYIYSWSNGSSMASIENLSSGTYSVEVTDLAGCLATGSVTLNAPEPITVNFVPEAPNCFNEDSGNIIFNSLSGGTGNFEYSLDGEFFSPVPALPFELTGLSPGDYTMYIQDDNDCLFESQATIPENQALSIDLGPDLFIELGSSVTLNGLPNFQVDSLIWIPSDSLSSPEELSTLATPNLSTTYTLLAFDENGCPAQDEIRVIVNRDVPVYIPTVFSPNGDGINDVFTVFGGQGVAMVNSLRIFDRWGNAVYEGGPFPPNDPGLGWNGKYNGQVMNPAVFVYYTEIIYLDGRKEMYKGEVTLLR